MIINTLSLKQLQYLYESMEIGTRENITIKGIGNLIAKVDTGNEGYNVIHGTNIKVNNGVVIFDTINDNNETVKLSKKIVDTVDINMGGGNVQERYVVLLDVMFGAEKFAKVPFSISDRSDNTCKVLLGLDFLENEVDAIIRLTKSKDIVLMEDFLNGGALFEDKNPTSWRQRIVNRIQHYNNGDWDKLFAGISMPEGDKKEISDEHQVNAGVTAVIPLYVSNIGLRQTHPQKGDIRIYCVVFDKANAQKAEKILTDRFDEAGLLSGGYEKLFEKLSAHINTKYLDPIETVFGVAPKIIDDATKVNIAIKLIAMQSDQKGKRGIAKQVHNHTTITKINQNQSNATQTSQQSQPANPHPAPTAPPQARPVPQPQQRQQPTQPKPPTPAPTPSPKPTPPTQQHPPTTPPPPAPAKPPTAAQIPPPATNPPTQQQQPAVTIHPAPTPSPKPTPPKPASTPAQNNKALASINNNTEKLVDAMDTITTPDPVEKPRKPRKPRKSTNIVQQASDRRAEMVRRKYHKKRKLGKK